MERICWKKTLETGRHRHPERVTKCLVGDFYAKARRCVSKKNSNSHQLQSKKVRITFTMSDPTLHISGTTSRRNSPTRSSSLRSGRRRPLSAAGPSCRSGRWSWRRPGACWWGEWGLPFPGFPLRHLGLPGGRYPALLPGQKRAKGVALPANQKFPAGTAVCHSLCGFISLTHKEVRSQESQPRSEHWRLLTGWLHDKSGHIKTENFCHHPVRRHPASAGDCGSASTVTLLCHWSAARLSKYTDMSSLVQ